MSTLASCLLVFPKSRMFALPVNLERNKSNLNSATYIHQSHPIDYTTFFFQNAYLTQTACPVRVIHPSIHPNSDDWINFENCDLHNVTVVN